MQKIFYRDSVNYPEDGNGHKNPTPTPIDTISIFLSMLSFETESIMLLRTLTSGSATVVRKERKNAATAINISDPCFGKLDPIASPIGSMPSLTP